ncbi:baseplate protein [Rosenbergiella metrosideri]|uniref:baseplate protein n=2 Tax=Rosenbergiella TaxID=1356488 RepID=UPI001F501425|nr:baseplate protein [Rosenbergiella metrosideri]
MDIQTLTDKFNNTIKGNSWWAKFANSQFIQMIAIFAGQVIYIAQTYASRALTEGFISTATKRTSILAAAEDKGYVGRFIIPSKGTIQITNKSTSTITVPAGMEMLTNDQTMITLQETRQIQPGETATGLQVSQIEEVIVDYSVDAQTPFLTVLLDTELTQEAADLTVSVINDGGEIEWIHNPLFRMSRETSEHYVMVYRPTEQLGVRFGNGQMGKMPPTGSIIRMKVSASRGDYTLAINQPLTPAGDYATLANILDIKNDTAIRSGAGHETTEETRNRAQYYVPYDGQVVWGGDYRYYIQSNVPNLAWLNVWGEQQQEQATGVRDVSNINKIFFCGHRPGYSQEEVQAMIYDAIGTIPNEMNKRYQYVPVNEKPFAINVTGIAKKNVILNEAINEIKDTLEKNFGHDSSKFGELFENDSSSNRIYAQVKIKDLWNAIEKLGIMISYDIQLNGFTQAVNLNDFVYLDLTKSTFTLNYP